MKFGLNKINLKAKNETDVTLRLSSNTNFANKNMFLLNLQLTLCGEFSHFIFLERIRKSRDSWCYQGV